MTLALMMGPYWWMAIPPMIVAMWAQYRLQSTYSELSQVGTDRGMTGAEAAREILDRNGLAGVPIHEVPGELTDHYDPSKRAVFLSEGTAYSTSVAAVGVAAHEVGHALQHKEAYAMLGLRMALVPVTGIASTASTILIFIGFLLGQMRGFYGLGNTLLILGIGFFSLVAFFQIITLPVEYDASARAKAQLQRLGLVTPREHEGVDRVLSAAALTYVAAMFAAVSQLLQLMLTARSRDDDR